MFYMRTHIMIQHDSLQSVGGHESKTDGYTLDTCFLINSWKNPNIAAYFKTHSISRTAKNQWSVVSKW